MAELSIRPMTAAEVASVALEWAAREGWNPGPHDAAPFHVQDPAGFLFGELNGEPVGCISAIVYPDAFGFLGFYIVRPELRGRGYGMQLWRAALEHLGERNVGLDGVVEQQHNYRKSGFRLAYNNARYRGQGLNGSLCPGIVPVAEVDRRALYAYDRELFPAPRPDFLDLWLAPPAGRAYVALDPNGCVAGYGVIRRCREGCKIGPLFAEDSDLADRLFRALVPYAEGGPVFLDIPEPHAAAYALTQRYGMDKVFATARMYSQYDPELPLARIFGVTSFELG